MTKIDRSKFKPTSNAAAKESDASLGINKSGGADYLKITPGVNYFRIYPVHPDDGGALFAQPKAVHWLPVEVAKKDSKGEIIKDKKGQPVTEVKNKPIFNAIVHGGQDKDLVEEYIAIANKIANETFKDDKEKATFLDPINGGYGSKNSGILRKLSWVMYVDKLSGAEHKPTFGRLEIGKAVRNRLASISATESANDPVGTDPFTDIEDGRAIVVNYNDKADKPQDYYTTELYSPMIKGGGGKIQLFPLSDEALAKFLELPSLKKLFVGAYNRKTFDTSLSALKNFDDEHQIGVFDYDDGQFLNIADKLLQELPEADEEKDQEAVASGREVDEFDDMDRDELKVYITKNKLGILVNGKVDDEQVREKIREVLLSRETKEETAEIVEKTPEQVAAEKQAFLDDLNGKTPPVEANKPSSNDRLQALRERMKK